MYDRRTEKEMLTYVSSGSSDDSISSGINF